MHTSWQTRNAHYDAVVQWGIPNVSLLERVQAITTPVFVANGDDDRMILPRYSHLLAGLMDGAVIKIYPEPGRGAGGREDDDLPFAAESAGTWRASSATG